MLKGMTGTFLERDCFPTRVFDLDVRQCRRLGAGGNRDANGFCIHGLRGPDLAALTATPWLMNMNVGYNGSKTPEREQRQRWAG